jgi:hypothetical protein
MTTNVQSDAVSIPSGGARPPPVGAVHVTTDRLTSSYCNVAIVNSTREEVVLSLGINQDWDRASPELQVALLKRIVMSPHGAKRFQQRLAQVLTEYEKRHGELQV